MKPFSLRGSALAVATALSSLAAAPALSQDFGSEFESIQTPQGGLNLIGLGVAGVPDFYGSDKHQGAPVPIFRYFMQGTNRYVQLLGPEVVVNVLDRPDWRLGPVLRVRGRRDDDVDNDVVKRMRPVPAATEVGVFAAYNLYLSREQPLHKVVFGGDVVGNTTGVYNGASGNLRVNYFYPFPRAWLGGRPSVGSIGLGLFWASESFTTKYFGVTGSDLALYPTLGGRPSLPGGGLVSVKIPFSVTTQINPKWLLTVGGRYERLTGDAKDSPVVQLHGNENQWLLGIAASYAF